MPSMQSEISPIDPVTVELRVQVPWDRVHQGLESEYGKLQKSARIKGFRQGRAPRTVIVRLFSKSVREEVTSNLVNESVVEAVQKHELPVVSTPVLKEAPQVVDGTGLSFTVKVEVRPTIESLDTSLELVRRVKPVTDADVDADLERKRQTHATVEPVEEARPSKKGDILTVDYTVSIDGEEQRDMAGDARSVELGSGQLLEEIEQGLTGAELGQARTITIARGADDANKELAGKTVVFTMTVKSMKERRVPALDDEFAKDVGDYETLAQLRDKTRADLEESAKAQAERALRDLAIERFVEKNEIPVPPSLLDQQVRVMAQEFLQLFQMMGQKPNLTSAMVEEMKPRAAAKVRAALLLGELSRKEGITVSPEEIEAKLKEMAEKSGKHIAKLRVEYTGDKREQLETQLLEEKLFARLLGAARITDGPWEDPEAKAKAEAEAQAKVEPEATEAKAAEDDEAPKAKAKPKKAKATKKEEP